MTSVDRQYSSDACSFCTKPCSGPFRHILTTSEETENLLKPVLLELLVYVSLPGIEGHQSCDTCRRRIISVHRIPESRFQIMPSVEIFSVKMEPETNFENIQSSTGDEEMLHLIPETEMHVEDDDEQGFVFNGLDDRLTVEEKGAKKVQFEPVLKARHRKRKKQHSPEADFEMQPKTEFPHRCPFCGKGFSDKYVMKTHIRWHTGEKPFQCELCAKRFYENSKLKVHMRTHTGERPYTCPYCPKTFTQSVTLRIHIRIHTRETPYVCEICDRGFTQSYSLTLHLRNQHNQVTIYRGREVGIVPEYKCKYCGKIYRSAKSYQLHVKLHSTGKLFDCARCGKKYTFVHKCRAETDDSRVFPCQICGQEFRHQQSVVYHMSSKHNQFEHGLDRPEKENSNDEVIVGC